MNLFREALQPPPKYTLIALQNLSDATLISFFFQTVVMKPP